MLRLLLINMCHKTCLKVTGQPHSNRAYLDANTQPGKMATRNKAANSYTYNYNYTFIYKYI